MKKDIQRKVIILMGMAVMCFLTIFFFLGLYAKKGVGSVAFAENCYSVEKHGFNVSGDNIAYMSDERDYILNLSDVDIPFTVKSKNIIESYSYESNFFILSTKQIDSHNLIFSLRCIEYKNDLKLQVSLKMSNGDILNSSLYAVYNKYGLFISRFSQEDSVEKYIRYALKNSLIKDWQAEQIRYENDCIIVDTHEEEESSGIGTAINLSRAQTNSTTSGDTYIHGTLKWRETNEDTSPAHFLRGVKVEVRDSDLIGSQLLGTTFTENDGSYSISFTNDSSVFENGGCDLFIRVYAGDDNAYVVQSDGSTRYYIDSNHEGHQNVATGSDTAISLTFKMTTDSRKALQISQALMTAQDFAWDMMGSLPHSVIVRYPYGTDGCYYDNNMITITGVSRASETVPESYASWDVIMHEYGHHIAHHRTIDDSPGGWHIGSINMVDHYAGDGAYNCDGECAAHRTTNPISAENAKEEAHKLIWSEAWATAFGFIAQEYSSEYIGTVPTVCNESYDAYNFDDPYNFQQVATNKKYGENFEIGVYTILWDLFDTNNTTSYDKLSLSYRQWWDITTISGTYTFSAFMNNFYSQYPELIGEIGYNLEYYHISPWMHVIESDIEELGPTMTPFTISYSFYPRSIFFEYDELYATLFSEDYSQSQSILLTNRSYSVSSSTFALVQNFVGKTIHIMFKAIQSGNAPGHPTIPQGIMTGPYYSHSFTIEKRIFKTTLLESGDLKITGTYCDIFGELRIPEKIDNRNVTQIGDEAFSRKSMTRVTFENASIIQSIEERAFYYCPNLLYAVIPQNVETLETGLFESVGGQLLLRFMGNLKNIGARVFMENDMSNMDPFPDSIETIGNNAFMSTIVPNNLFSKGTMNLKSIGTAAFTGSDIKTIILPKHEAPNAELTISTLAFYLANYLTIYTPYNAKPSTWSTTWNASNRPVVWGCTLSSDSKYVVSFNKTSSNPSNATAQNGMNNPTRSGYTFGGWYTTSDYSGTKYDDIASAPNGTLYAKWTSSSCIAAGSLITLADGSQVAVENLTGNENLLVWNMLTGQYDTAPILFIDSDPLSSYEIIKLTFSDNTEVKVIDEHAFFDMTIGEYVFMRNDASQYIGHYFNKQGINGTYTTVQLINVTVYNETTTAWSPVTYGHLCYYVNGMLSMPGGTEGLINIFDVDTSLMQYDEEQMEEDILTYGLYTYEEFNAIIPLPEYVFDAFNGQYLKVSIGKGLITLDEIAALLERYAAFFE